MIELSLIERQGKFDTVHFERGKFDRVIFASGKFNECKFGRSVFDRASHKG